MVLVLHARYVQYVGDGKNKVQLIDTFVKLKRLNEFESDVYGRSSLLDIKMDGKKSWIYFWIQLQMSIEFISNRKVFPISMSSGCLVLMGCVHIFLDTVDCEL